MEVTTNEINEGLHVDFSEVDQPKGTYRSSVNGDIFVKEGDKFHWKPKNGNLYAFSIRYGFFPIACYAILDRLYILSCNIILEDPMSDIGYVNLINNVGGTYFSIYYHTGLNFSRTYPPRIKGERETENIERIYWRDGRNRPRVLNLYDIINTPEQPYCTTLIAGKQYLNVGTTTYGYSERDHVHPGGTFTAVYDNTVNPTMFKLVKYIPYGMLEWSPIAEAGIMTYDQMISGGLNYGNYFFIFRYGLDSGYVSSWQNTIGPVSVININNGLMTTPQGTAIHDSFQQTQGKSHLLTSNYGIRLILTELDVNYDYIQIAYIHCTEEEISEGAKICIKQEILQNTRLTIDIKYNFNFGIVPIADIITKNIVLLDYFAQEILKSRMNIGNITESEELPIGDAITGCVLRDEIYEYPIDWRGYPTGADTAQTALVSAVIAKDSKFILPGQQYIVEGTTGQTLTYDGTTYPIGAYFIGKNTVITHTGNATGAPVFRMRKYYDRHNGTEVYETHKLQIAHDYKDPIMACYARGHWGNQNYRFALMGFDERLNPMFCRYLDDHLTAERNCNTTAKKSTIVSMGKTVPGYYSVVNGVDTYNADDTDTQLIEPYYYAIYSPDHFYNGKILSVSIDNLDLTDIIDHIHAFAIVRVPRERTIVSEGWLEPVVKEIGDFANVPAAENYRARLSSITFRDFNNPEGSHDARRVPNWYVLIDPEKMFRKNDKETIIPDDVFVLKRYMQTETGHNETVENDLNKYRKYYNELETLPYGAHPIDSETRALYFAHADQDPQTKVFVDPTDPLKHFNNVCDISEQPIEGWADIQHYIIGGRCTVIRVDDDGNATNGFGYWPGVWPADNTDYQTAYLPIVQHKRAINSDYGGSNKYALAASQYIFTNHFQIVDAAFKEAIKKTVGGINTYVVSGIQIFGGDCFINIFDYKRSIIDYNLIYTRLSQRGFMTGDNVDNAMLAEFEGVPIFNSFIDPSIEHGYSLGESLMVPLQSEMNLAYRQEKHISKDRSYAIGFKWNELHPVGSLPEPLFKPFSDGIKYKNYDDGIIQFPQYEQYLYDDSYTSKHANIVYPAYPESLELNNIWPSRMRFSTKKNPGESIDSYRIFKSDNVRNLNRFGGKITNLFAYQDRLYYFMDKLVGYIPVGERAMNSIDGMVVQMGIGGEYERYDDRNKFYGVQHAFGIVQVPDGFVWFDSINKSWIHMSYDFGLSNESVIKGCDSLFDPILDSIKSFDNPVLSMGVFLYYSPEEKRVYGQIIHSSTDLMIGYDTLSKKFIGTFTWRITGACAVRQHVYAFSNTKDFYLQNAGPKRTWFGILHRAEIEVVINVNNDIIKSFHYGEFLQADNFFDIVTYTTDNQTVVEDLNAVDLTDYYKKKMGKKWNFNFPQITRIRLYGTYLKINFRTDHTAVTDNIDFYKLITNFENIL